MQGAVYRIRDPDGEGDIVIVDPGYAKGDLHVYRHEYSVSTDDVVEQAEDDGITVEERSYLGHTLSKLEYDTRPNQRWKLNRH